VFTYKEALANIKLFESSTEPKLTKRINKEVNEILELCKTYASKGHRYVMVKTSYIHESIQKLRDDYGFYIISNENSYDVYWPEEEDSKDNYASELSEIKRAYLESDAIKIDVQ